MDVYFFSVAISLYDFGRQRFRFILWDIRHAHYLAWLAFEARGTSHKQVKRGWIFVRESWVSLIECRLKVVGRLRRTLHRVEILCADLNEISRSLWLLKSYLVIAFISKRGRSL